MGGIAISPLGCQWAAAGFIQSLTPRMRAPRLDRENKVGNAGGQYHLARLQHLLSIVNRTAREKVGKDVEELITTNNQ